MTMRPTPVAARLFRAVAILTLLLALSIVAALLLGNQRITPGDLLHDSFSRTLFLRLRLPRVIMGALIGASLAVAGGALQALFSNPLAEPYTLGVSGGGTLGASIAIALGWSLRIFGIPFVYVTAFVGAMSALLLVRVIARSGSVVAPGALLLSGVVVNFICAAGVLTVQYMADPSAALHMLRWMIGSLDVIGFAQVWRTAAMLLPAWILLLALARPLHLLAMDSDSATTLGVNVPRLENAVHFLSAFVVAVTISAGGTIGFVGLIVPHAVRMLFGEDLRIVLPGSLLLGASVLMLADALARTVLPSGELPVGAVTGLLGGPAFLWLLRRRQRYSALS
jgi:iron complex transport system permease protein